MKKVSLLLLVVVLAATLLAAIPTRVVRLTIINKSENDVYIKLEGSPVTENYYYLTIPSGTRDEPVIKVFTIMEDVYSRTTWQCNGLRSTGTLIVDGNLRLTFTPCGEFACGWSALRVWVDRCSGNLVVASVTKRPAGEPRMEKVTYFRYLSYGSPDWINAYLYAGYWNVGCGLSYYRLRTYRTPIGCEYRYQY